jgi:hypothetical protein
VFLSQVDGKAFTGYGMSASRAKVQASEKALKFILLEQLSKSQQAAATESKEEPKGQLYELGPLSDQKV